MHFPSDELFIMDILPLHRQDIPPLHVDLCDRGVIPTVSILVRARLRVKIILPATELHYETNLRMVEATALAVK